MFKKITERIFPFLIALTALSVSASAAFYSVSGLSKLFAGARFEEIIMAGSLEVAKLVIASLLYQYRKTIPKLLKGYLTTACIVLVLITSMGIYGFLSAAYQETANKENNQEARIVLIETKRDNVKNQLEVYTVEKESTDEAVVELRKGLSNNKIQWKDKESGQIITSTSSRTRKALERQLDQAIERQTEVNKKIDDLNEQIFNYESEIVETRIGDGSTSELGPLKYLAGLTGFPMDKIINVLLLIIIFVFDPLAIALVIAANFAFERLKRKQHEWVEDKMFAEHVDDILDEDEDEWDDEVPWDADDDDDDDVFEEVNFDEEEFPLEADKPYTMDEVSEALKIDDEEDLLDQATKLKEKEKRDSFNEKNKDEDDT